MVLSMVLCVEKSLHNWPWVKNHLLIYHHLKLKGLQHLGIGKPHFERLVFLRITMLRKVCLPLAAGSTITVMEWQGLVWIMEILESQWISNIAKSRSGNPGKEGQVMKILENYIYAKTK